MGQIIKKQIRMPFSTEERTVRIYLPGDYYENEDKRYPVLYLHDGQNVFYGKTVFGGESWNLLDTLEKMEEAGFAGVIAAGLDNAQEERSLEYLAWKNDTGNAAFPVGSQGGNGDAYADFFAKDFKAYIDSHFRTLPDYENTAVCGSSMGGYITAYIVAKYPDIYSKAGIFSLASWLAEKPLLDYVSEHPVNRNTKYFIQVGTQEDHIIEEPCLPQMYVDCSLRYYKTILENGADLSKVHLGIGVGDRHEEAAWSKYMKEFVLF